jgi:mono/diheme cytochrome c family protein
MPLSFRKISTKFFLFIGTCLLPFVCGAEKTKKISFHDDIRPIFQANCNGCHQPAKMKGDYLMTHFLSLLKGGETGKSAVVPGKPFDSYLIDQIKINPDGSSEMPKGKNAKALHPIEYKKIVQWIKEGA